MYHTICTILRYDTIHTIRTLYLTIMSTYDMPILYGIFYTQYDMYCISYDTDNYDLTTLRGGWFTVMLYYTIILHYCNFILM